MDLTFCHVQAEHMGYGSMGLNIAAALRRAGVNLNAEHPSDDEAETVCWASIPAHAHGWWKNQRPTILTMWEACRLPEGMSERLHNFDMVLVPSQQNVELFSEHHPNVQLLPLGIDPTVWSPIERTVDDKFFFLVCGAGSRKAPELALAAFEKAFPAGSWNGPEPWLRYKAPRGSEMLGERVESLVGRLPLAQEAEVYRTSHCAIAPSRGEGFGMQPLQAMATGMPTILTAAHGHAGFAHLGHPVSSKLVPSAYFAFGDAGEWWEPDVDEIAERMRWVYENYESALTRAKASAEIVARDWTWDHTARRMIDVLGPLPKLAKRGPWVEPTSWHWPVTVAQAVNADIGEARIRIAPGETQWHIADVKRVLQEAGVLDPSCLNQPAREAA